MTTILEEAKQDFDLFHNNHLQYKKKVDDLSVLFGLKNKTKLRSDYLATYLIGDFEDDNYKYVLFGINPGFSEEQNPIEESWKKNSWTDYLNFVKNFFVLFKKYNMKSRYYKRLSKLFSGFDNIELEGYDEIFDYYHKHLISIELIPYHSISFGISSELNKEQKLYFEKRLNASIDFLKKIKVKLVIFNGSPFYLLLIKNNLINYDKKIKINESVNMYIFKIKNVSCVLFDKFITQPAFGLTHDDLQYKIPDLIRAEFNQFDQPIINET